MKNEIIQGNNLPKIEKIQGNNSAKNEKIQGNNFPRPDEMLEKDAIVAAFSPALFHKLALPIETLLIQPEHYKNILFWLNKNALHPHSPTPWPKQTPTGPMLS